MQRLFTLATVLTLIGAAMPASAQHFSAEELDRMAQDRQQETGLRNWGPPINPTSRSPNLKPLPVAAICRSPMRQFEPLYAALDINARKVGVAGSQIAITDVQSNGWRQVLRHGKEFAWIPEEDVKPYKPLIAGHATHCVVAGELDNGMVMFTYSK